MRFGFVGPSYTAKSTAVADEECINLYAETAETAGSISPARSYGGQTAQGLRNYYGTPGLATFIDFGADAPVRGSIEINGRVFVAAGASLYEIFANNTPTPTNWGAIANDGSPVIIAASTVQLLVVSFGHAYCFDLTAPGAWAANTQYNTGAVILDPAGKIQNATARAWQANTVYSAGTQIVDANGNIQQVTTPGTSGASEPTWNTSGTTADNSAVWTYEAIGTPGVAGTSGATEPTFVDTPGGSTSDGTGTLVWEFQGNQLLDVTAQLAGTPGRVRYADGYFVLNLAQTNQYQVSNLFDGTTWSGLQINPVSVFPENIISIEWCQRILLVMGENHIQAYQDTGSNEIFDVIPGTLIETGCISQNCPCILNNAVYWVGRDVRGGLSAWQSTGYSTPQRVSTHAVEIDLQSYTLSQLGQLTTYSYQDGGHLFWVLYVPGSKWSWVYDVAEQLWHKRAYWESANGPFTPHRSWNHVFAFGMHLVGDWNSGNLYRMAMALDNGDGTFSFVSDNGNPIRRLRRAPTNINEMQWIRISKLTIDIQTGIAPQPPLVDGLGNPRQPQCMLRWSDTRGKSWSNEHIGNLGFAGQYPTRVIFWRQGMTRYRVYEWSMTDPVPVVIVDAYLELAQ